MPACGASDALLKASIAKSHSPYYLMRSLGSNARKQGKKDEALRWYEGAFNKSEAPPPACNGDRTT